MRTCLRLACSQVCFGEDTCISLIDSTLLTVCNTRRIHSPPSLKKTAQRGKTYTGYFYRCKLHLVINDKGEILAYMLALGNSENSLFSK